MDKNVESFIMKSPKEWERDCVEMCPGVNLYTLPKVSIFIANRVVDFPAGQHSHNDYEFMMPLNNDMIVMSGNKTFLAEKQKLMPFNSGQSHGVPEDTKVDRVICISCEKDLLEQISFEGFGKSKICFENVCFEISNNMRFMLGLFVEESVSKHDGFHIMQSNLAKMLFIEIIRCSRNNVTVSTNTDTNTETRINRAIDFLKEQCLTDFSIEEAARVAGLSPFYFIRTFKAQTGKTPYSYYIDVKIQKAKELLLKKELGITEVALACGFSNSAHFSTAFKRKTGVSPTEYKKTSC